MVLRIKELPTLKVIEKKSLKYPGIFFSADEDHMMGLKAPEQLLKVKVRLLSHFYFSFSLFVCMQLPGFRQHLIFESSNVMN